MTIKVAALDIYRYYDGLMQAIVTSDQGLLHYVELLQASPQLAAKIYGIRKIEPNASLDFGVDSFAAQVSEFRSRKPTHLAYCVDWAVGSTIHSYAVKKSELVDWNVPVDVSIWDITIGVNLKMTMRQLCCDFP